MRLQVGTVAVLAAACLSAAPVYVGGTGAVAFGVANYGGPPVGAPTYILNNVYGTNDVMTSPGNGFLTANTSNINNVASFAGTLPGGAAWVGGGNINGVFGSGAVVMNATNIAFSLTDVNPDGTGAAAFAIGTWQSTFANVGAWNGTMGNWLGISGVLSTVNSAAAVSLRTRMSAVGGLFGGGFVLDLPQLVLAAAGNGNFQALGSSGAAVQHLGGGLFRGLAVNNLGLFNLTGGEIMTMTTTLTAIADPASFDSVFGPQLDAQMGTDFDFPDFAFNETGPVPNDFSEIPEPGTWAMMIGALGALAYRRFKK